MHRGFIKLHRKMLEWEWYDDANTFRVFIHCILRVNHKDKKYRGILVPRGSMTTSVSTLAKELNLSVRQIRTALDKLKSTENLTIKTTNRFTMITVCNYDSYNYDNSKNDKQLDKQMTNKRQTNDKQMTTNKNVKNVKNEKNEKNIISKDAYGEFKTVTLSKDEYNKLLNGWGVNNNKKYISKTELQKAIELLDTWQASKGKRNKSSYATMQGWVYNRILEERTNMDKQFVKKYTAENYNNSDLDTFSPMPDTDDF